MNASGYVGFHLSKHVAMQFGHGRHFIGNGHRSLLLSDFANNRFYLQINTRVWKIHYQNLFAELGVTSPKDSGIAKDVLRKKYLAAHYLSFRPAPNFSIGLYEAIIFSRTDQFELQYLNPIILYRTVEQGLQSPDNAFIGLDLRWDLWKKIRLYGQLMFDEFFFQELIIERRGWWANKYSFQLGAKCFDCLGVEQLDIAAEVNVVRPYTYMHLDSAANYSHQFQALAHPLGANFREYLLLIRYQPFFKWQLDAKFMRSNVGLDENGNNWGGNLIRSYQNRVRNFDNVIGQGQEAVTAQVFLDISYQLYHNLFLELNYQFRQQELEGQTGNAQTHYLGAGLRLNFVPQTLDF